MKVTTSFFCLFLLVGFSAGFIPGVLRQFADWSSLTHRIITRAGLWSTVMEFLKDKPEYANDRQKVNKLVLSLIQPQLYQGQIPHELLGLVQSSRFEDAVKEIEDSNVQVDSNEAEFTASHFDAEQFRKSSLRLLLIKKRVIALILNAKYETARQEAGRYLHTLQDFYSHSNWIEFGNVAPLEILGDELIAADHVAAAEEKTCQTCTPTKWSRLFFQTDDCQNNLIFATRKLTSGYFGGQDVAKPANGGKCSHGGLFDSTREKDATGGINKDTNKRDFSPHYRQHKTAASVAIKATKLFFDNVHTQVGDEKFAKFLNMEAFRTISFVIDTTGSMHAEIAAVQRATVTFIQAAVSVHSTRLHYVLVPFSDPTFGPAYVTSFSNVAITRVNALNAQGGGDCAEMGMSGLYLALVHSLPNSDVYFFTDAAAKDAHLAPAVTSLALKKSCKIYFFISGSCSVTKRRRRRSVSERELYEMLAGSTGGQYVTYRKFYAEDVINLIGNPNGTEGSRKVELLSVQGHNATDKMYVVRSESSILSMTAVLSAEDNANIQVTPPSGAGNQDITVVTQISTVHGVRVVKPSAGSWIFKITASGRYSFQVTAQSTLEFSTTLEQYQESATFQNVLAPIAGNPVKGKPLHLTVTPSQPDVLQTDQTIKVDLIDLAGNKLQSFDLERGGEIYNNSYYGSVEMKYDTFMIMYQGLGENGEIIQRLHPSVITLRDFELNLKPSSVNNLILSPDEAKTIEVTLKNLGPTSDFSIGVSDEKLFAVSYQPKDVSLAKGRSVDIKIIISVPSYFTNITTSSVSVAATELGSAQLVTNFVSFDIEVFPKDFLAINENEATTKQDIISFLPLPSTSQPIATSQSPIQTDDDGLATFGIVLITVFAALLLFLIIAAIVVWIKYATKNKENVVQRRPHEVYSNSSYA